MKRNLLISISLSAAILLVYSCLDPYNPPATRTDVHYLVVGGFFNSNGLTQIKLSRTSPIHESTVTPEIGATVQIEGDDGTIFTLAGDNLGTYSLSAVVIDTSRRFRLTIKTSGQKEYASVFVPVKQAPDLDTLRYTLDGEDLQLYISTHDDHNNTHYYLWKFAETWAYRSYSPSEWIFDNGIVTLRPSPNELYYCWSTIHSSQILIGSSAKLAQDIIHDYPIQLLNVHSEKLQMKYSILVEQFALTSEAHEYWEQLKKSTEAVGSIFDPQPSQSPSNIHGITNTEEPVVGYFNAGSVRQRRIFIRYADLPPVRSITGYESCEPDTLWIANVPDFRGTELLTTGIFEMNTLLGYQMLRPYCVDCRLKGGTTTMPDFWE